MRSAEYTYFTTQSNKTLMHLNCWSSSIKVSFCFRRSFLEFLSQQHLSKLQEEPQSLQEKNLPSFICNSTAEVWKGRYVPSPSLIFDSQQG